MIDWVQGDMLRLDMPAHREALRAGGTDFLTRAFRAAGALPADNAVTAITRLEECGGGSTGRKLLLSVAYAKSDPALHHDLFVKFSRDFDDPLRDRARFQMERETQFALLSRSPGFPIAVPACYFSDFHRESGTGVLITERIGFGRGNIERHYDKCLDYDMPGPLQHYRALVSALGRLAGSHRGGRLPDTVDRTFPFDPADLSVSKRDPYTPQQIRNRVARYADFARTYPAILPGNIRCAAFIERLARQAPRMITLAPAVREWLASEADYIALCHWNANVDNAWFWAEGDGSIACGLMDWGHVSQMNVAMALWGSLSGAETDLWNNHLEELLQLFASEFHHSGGPELDVQVLRLQLQAYAAIMGLAWLLDAPPLILQQVPDLSRVESRCDDRFRNNEFARAQLHLMTTFLNLWETHDMELLLDLLEKRPDTMAPSA